MAQTFSDLEFKSHPNHLAGFQAKCEFANGYAVSVIQTPYSYGGENGLYELAVLHDGHLVYDTPVTEDVLGHLTEEEVTARMAQVEALPARSEQVSA